MQNDHWINNRIENEPGLASAVGAVTGILFSTSMAAAAGVSVTGDPGAILLHFTSAILGGYLAVRTLSKEPGETPLLTVLCFMTLALPAFIVLESAFGDQVYRLAGWTISTDAFIGFRILMAASMAGIGISVAEANLAPADEPFELASAEERYRAAIRRLARMDVAIEESHSRGERQLADFDARLRAEGVTLDFDTQAERRLNPVSAKVAR